jgi:BirA family biotin operon repressor/biotin-[acetyl-CoA-carboxylase] ligase
LEFNVNNSFFTGKFLLQLPSVDSTNAYAKDFLSKNSPIDGTVILADKQLAGRGQSGTTWLAEPGKNLTFSLIYHTSFLQAQEQFFLNMAVSLGLQSAAQYIIRENMKGDSLTKIKWPNDIYINEKKTAGILIENTISGMQLKYSVIGIGLNVNQRDFPKEMHATSLLNEAEKELDLNYVLNIVLSRIEKYFLILRERKFETLKMKYLENLYRYKIQSTFNKAGMNFPGVITDIDQTGRLIVETENGQQAYGFKEISFVHPL